MSNINAADASYGEGKSAASPNTWWGKTVRLLWAAGWAYVGYTGSVPSLPSSLTPWNTDFTAPLSGAYSFLEEWPNQYLSFIWSRWHQSQTKGPGALEGNSLGGEKKKAQQIAVWLRTYSQKLCSSPSPSHGLQSDFLSSVSFACHTALGSRCQSSHLTVEKGGITAIQWTCMSHVRSRERGQPHVSPPHCTAATMSPGVREGDCLEGGWDGTTQHTHHSSLAKSD